MLRLLSALALLPMASAALAQSDLVRGSVFVEWGFGKGEVRWDGTLSISAGTVTNLEAYSFDASPKVDKLVRSEMRWDSLTIGYTDGLNFDVAGPPDATLTLDTKPGKFQATLRQLAEASPLTFFAADENKLVMTFSKLLAPTRVRIGDDTIVDDYPAIAAGPDGAGTVAWLRFEDGADRIMAAEFDGGTLGEPVAVTPEPGDNFRPQAVVLRDGTSWVVWPARVNGDWDIYACALQDGRPGRIRNVSASPGPDLHCSVIDYDGSPLVVWQGWRDGSFDIIGKTFGGGREREWRITDSPANDWEPSIAAGVDGQLTCVWDTYRNGSYDVYARMLDSGKWSREMPIAATADFEAHASVAYDSSGVAWVVWESGGPDWGKDSKTAGLHSSRRLEMRCLWGGQVHEPAQPLTADWPESIAKQCEIGQLVSDGDGRLWLFFRHLVKGGVWAVHTSVHGPEGWSAPAMLPDSKGRQDQQVGVARGPLGAPWVAWQTDNRTRNIALNSDVIAARLVAPDSDPAPPERGPKVDVDLVVLPAEPSHPRRALFPNGERRLLLGDLHRHTDLSVCQTGKDGSMADLYRYGLDAAKLDFITVTDHIQHQKVPSAYERWRTEKMADMYLVPGRFTPLFAYERSQRFPYGHRNVISPTRGQLPIPRTEDNKPADANRTYEGEARIAPSKLWQSLLATNPNQVTIPHTSGNGVMGQDWQFDDPELEPVVEIFQGCRISYECPGAPDPHKPESNTNRVGSIWAALAKGYRLGFIASSDHAATHNSYAGIYATEHTRQAIIDAIRQRATFAATDTFAVQFSADGHPLGSEIEAAVTDPPVLGINVLAPQPLTRLDIIKDNTVLMSTTPDGRRAKLDFVDTDVSPGTSYYYVRAIQEDQMMAWGSPIWVTYR